MKIGKKIFLSLMFLLSLDSCIIPKEARILKKETKEWRDSKAVLWAYADSPLSGSFLILRENGIFEHTSSGLIGSFAAGSWGNSKDTIILSYFDIKHNVSNKRKVKIDRPTSTLIFEGDSTPIMFRLRLMINGI